MRNKTLRKASPYGVFSNYERYSPSLYVLFELTLCTIAITSANANAVTFLYYSNRVSICGKSNKSR